VVNLADFFIMRPDKPSEVVRNQLQLFQARLDSQLDMKHPLVILGGLIDWDRFYAEFASLFCPDNGAPALPVRLMVGLEILKYTYDLSDEELVERWRENPYWQYFCGEVFFQTELPLHSTSLGKWRLRVGAEKLKVIIEETIRIAKEQKFTTTKDLSRVIVDTTVQ
jgi:IS5 family transposase